MTKFCSNCGARLNSSAEFCSNCGAKTNLASSDDSKSSYGGNVVFRCPVCDSENVQKCSVIYQSGISSSNAATLADKFVAVTKGVNMTALAQSVAPPAKKENSWFLTVVCALATLLFLDDDNKLMFLICLCGTGWFLKENLDTYNYNEKVWPDLYDTWLHTYLCHRCGNVFVIR